MRMMTTDDAMAVHFGLSLLDRAYHHNYPGADQAGNCGISTITVTSVSQVIRVTPSDTLSMIEITFLLGDVLLFNMQENVVSLSVYVRKRQIPTLLRGAKVQWQLIRLTFILYLSNFVLKFAIKHISYVH